MKRLGIIIVVLIILTGLGYSYLRYLNYHPIKAWHQFPQLTRKIPVLKKLDKLISASAGIEWYKVIHKKTGRIYLLKIGYRWSEKTSWVTHYWVMDNERRDRWVEFTQEQFDNSFGSPADGQAMQEVYYP